MRTFFALGLILVLVSSIHFSISDSNKKLYSNTWALQIDGGKEEADRIARTHGFTNLGPLGTLEGFYVFRHDDHPRRSRRSVDDSTERLLEEPYVRFAEQQVIKRRVKRGYNPNLNDPLFEKQWFIRNSGRGPFGNYDHNILPVWQEGVFGRGVVVSILDDGIEYTHSDLRQNYDSLASWDFNSHDDNPLPRPTWNNENRHGTRCAGEVAAQFNNSVCTAGVAPMARVGGVRMLDGDVTDAVEAGSLSLHPQHIEIYSASWGPDDDGSTVDGPARLARKAFTDGIEKGRGGLGSIYVWASGNGGRVQDNCNCDGYTNSIFTLSISSATEHGQSPWYSESCSSTLATAFSSGSYSARKIVTTDLNNGCTESHTGTSASAPLAAGILALALEVNRNLTWRDMQHIVVRTASMDKLQASSTDRVTNGAGRQVDHRFGYGLLDAHALVKLARQWKTVPEQKICLEIPSAKASNIPDGGTLTVTTHATGCEGRANEIRYLEHVECVITLTARYRGGLSIYLTSPLGTRSTLLGRRIRDSSRKGFHNWAFMTTHSWEENPVGTWKLEIMNRKSRNDSYIPTKVVPHVFIQGYRVYGDGKLYTWQLKFYGTKDHPNSDEARKKQPVQACHLECDGGCSGPQATQCHSCKNYKRNLTEECVPSCSSGEFADEVTKQCRPCSFTCASCSGSTSSDCSSCHPPLIIYNGKCVNLCPAGWYKTNARCSQCAASCKTCAGSPTQCTDCYKGLRLIDSKCVKRCLPGEFLDGSRCKKCHPSCKACSREGHLGCTKCGDRVVGGVSSKLFLANGQCKHSCPSGTFADNSTHECTTCDASCSSCTSAGKDKCVACRNGLYRVGSPQGTCSQSCPKGHFASHGVCMSCDPSCASCSSSHPNRCTSCGDGKYLHNYACVTAKQCPKGTYANSKEKSCDPCYDTCAACGGSADNQCTSCSDGYHLWSSKCVLQCPGNTFQSAKGSCQPCPATCQTCYGASNTSCLSCVPSRVLSENQCVSECPNGTFHDRTKHHCVSCHPTCATCNGTLPSNCHSCPVDWSLQNDSTCVSSCPEGQYHTNGGCKNCHRSCQSCTGPSDRECSSCKGVKFFDAMTGACLYQCSDGYYGQTMTAICKLCPTGCKRCAETLECTTCMPGLILHKKSCIAQCPSGTYYKDDSRTCEKCESGCLECNGQAGNCTKCRDHRVLSENKCISICPKGNYLVKDNHHCRPCHPSCAECIGPGHDRCTKCDGGLVRVWSLCVDKCPQAFYYNAKGEQCEPCDYYCQKCEGGNGLTNCTRCTPPFVLNDHYCVRECAKVGRYYDRKNGECRKCHSTCSRCVGPSKSDCITCANPSHVLQGFTCIGNCSLGQFKNTQQGVCENCHPTCSECVGSGATECSRCVKGLIYSESQRRCISDCQEGQFKDGNTCKACHSSCRTCNGAGEKQCLSCASGQVYYQHACRPSCPSSTFLHINNKSQISRCIPCHAVCKSCSGRSADTCTSCKPPLILQQSSCVLQCSSRFTMDKRTNVCTPCKKSCPDNTSGRPRNRSVQDPTVKTLRVLLADPSRSLVLPFAILSILICVALFFAIFGFLQLRSTGKLCWKTRYVRIDVDEEDDKTEHEMGLIENEDNFEET